MEMSLFPQPTVNFYLYNLNLSMFYFRLPSWQLGFKIYHVGPTLLPLRKGEWTVKKNRGIHKSEYGNAMGGMG